MVGRDPDRAAKGGARSQARTVECAASQRRRAPGRPVTLSAKLLARALDKAPYLAGRLSRDPHGFRVGARSRSISSRM
jgi:hypothetical protein